MLATQQRGTGSGQAMERRASVRNGPGALSTSNGGGQDDVDDLERLARPILTRRKGAQWPGVMNNHRRALAAGWGPQLPHEVLAACAVWHAAVAVGGRGVPVCTVAHHTVACAVGLQTLLTRKRRHARAPTGCSTSDAMLTMTGLLKFAAGSSAKTHATSEHC